MKKGNDLSIIPGKRRSKMKSHYLYNLSTLLSRNFNYQKGAAYCAAPQRMEEKMKKLSTCKQYTWVPAVSYRIKEERCYYRSSKRRNK
jgi:hypothetical protein